MWGPVLPEHQGRCVAAATLSLLCRTAVLLLFSCAVVVVCTSTCRLYYCGVISSMYQLPDDRCVQRWHWRCGGGPAGLAGPLLLLTVMFVLQSRLAARALGAARWPWLCDLRCTVCTATRCCGRRLVRHVSSK
jgi:hypothetical protein